MLLQLAACSPKLPSGVDEQKLLVKAGRSRFTLSTLPANDFPTVEEGPGSLTFNLVQSKLRRLIERTSFAMAQQDVRDAAPAFEGLHQPPSIPRGVDQPVSAGMLDEVAVRAERLIGIESAIRDTALQLQGEAGHCRLERPRIFFR